MLEGLAPAVATAIAGLLVWKFEEFVTAMRTGVDPNGHAISKEMPWQPIGRMDKDELRAIYEYLTQLPND